MKGYKAERNWADLERADKVAILVGLLMWAAIETGIFVQSVGGMSNIKQMVKSEFVSRNR